MVAEVRGEAVDPLDLKVRSSCCEKVGLDEEAVVGVEAVGPKGGLARKLADDGPAELATLFELELDPLGAV